MVEKLLVAMGTTIEWGLMAAAKLFWPCVMLIVLSWIVALLAALAVNP